MLTQETVLVEQIVLNFIKNVMIKIYETPNKGYSFRLVAYQNNTEFDPINFSNKSDWAYGPYKSPKEAKETAKSLYKEHK